GSAALPLAIIGRGNLLHRTTADCGGVVCFRGYAHGRAGLDEQPSIALLAPPIFHQNPFSLELLATHNDVHLALVKCGGGISGQVPIFALIPDHDCSCSIVARRDGSFEVGVFKGMILDVHGESRFPWLRGWSLRYCP